MAKYTITHSCGHQAEHQIAGKESERPARAQWLRERVCYACYKAEQIAQDKAEAAIACEAIADLPLAPLKGSPKQISWAETIRAKAIADVRSRMTAFRDRQVSEGKLAGEALEARNTLIERTIMVLAATAQASWWIDRRDSDYRSFVTAAQAQM